MPAPADSRPPWRHICVDMQRMFLEDTPWHVEWMGRILPQVLELASVHPEATIFTLFLTPETPAAAQGAWKEYYRKWWMMTGEHLSPDLLQLVPELAALVPPARIFQKTIYSPWLGGELHAALQREQVERLVISGGETDVCVMATALGAVDLGYHVTLVGDALCSGADETHDATLKVLGDRFSTQLNVMSTRDVLASLA